MIVEILSAAYSGSTLLDAMLDSQEGIHGMGECAQCWEEKVTNPATGRPGLRGPCHLCGCVAEKCHFWRDYFKQVKSSKSSSAWAWERLGGVIVDASKAPHRLSTGYVPSVKILITKAPHEWAHSVLSHHPERTLESAWEDWERLHVGFLKYIDSSSAPLLLTYRELATAPAATLQAVCLWLNAPCDPGPVEDGRMWNRKSHALGGNPAVIDQLSQTEKQTGGRAEWLGGKYAGDRWRAIRYDDAWRADDSFRGQCATLYRAASLPMRAQLVRLGFGDAEDLARTMISK